MIQLCGHVHGSLRDFLLVWFPLATKVFSSVFSSFKSWLQAHNFHSLKTKQLNPLDGQTHSALVVKCFSNNLNHCLPQQCSPRLTNSSAASDCAIEHCSSSTVKQSTSSSTFWVLSKQQPTLCQFDICGAVACDHCSDAFTSALAASAALQRLVVGQCLDDWFSMSAS